MSESPITLDFLAQQQADMLAEIRTLRDDVRVLSAIAMRIDGTLSGLLAEIRAMHAQHDRMAIRVQKLARLTASRVSTMSACPCFPRWGTARKQANFA